MSIRLSEKHGVNPSVQKCFYCQKDVWVVLFGRLLGDAEAPRTVVMDHEPCDDCKEVMSRGVILISIDEKKSEGDMQNPYRTGGWCAVSDDLIRRLITPPVAAWDNAPAWASSWSKATTVSASPPKSSSSSVTRTLDRPSTRRSQKRSGTHAKTLSARAA